MTYVIKHKGRIQLTVQSEVTGAALLLFLIRIEVRKMARPMKWRQVCSLPENNRFGPLNPDLSKQGHVNMTVDEYETIRLIDLEGYNQEECAKQMNIARTTVQGIYVEARRKLAESLVNSKLLIIEGGEYRLCDGQGNGCGHGCHRRGSGRRFAGNNKNRDE